MQPANHPRAIQVPEISSPTLEDDVQILEELCQPPLAASTPPALTSPRDITSTTGLAQLKRSSCPGLDLSKELRVLNNYQYYGAVDVVEEYLDRMNSF